MGSDLTRPCRRRSDETERRSGGTSTFRKLRGPRLAPTLKLGPMASSQVKPLPVIRSAYPGSDTPQRKGRGIACGQASTSHTPGKRFRFRPFKVAGKFAVWSGNAECLRTLRGSLATPTAASHRVRLLGWFPSRRRLHALLACSEAHRSGLLADEARRIEIVCRPVRYTAQDTDPIAQEGCLLEVALLRRFLHRPMKLADGRLLALRHRNAQRRV